MAKTTLELPEDLFVQAKKRAAELRCALRDLIEAGLRRQLADPARAAKRQKKHHIRWVLVEGGLSPDLDLSDRTAMHRWVRGHRS